MAQAPSGGPEPPSGQARLLAVGALSQQIAQVSGLLALFAIVTVLARRLSLAELGVYGLLTSLAGYLLVIQNAAANAALRSMGGAVGAEQRTRAFSSAAVVFGAAGLATGLLVAVVGIVVSLAVSLPEDLRSQALLGSLGLGAVTALGWPLTIYRDALRAGQMFVRAALMDIAGMVVFAALVLALAFGGASLALLIIASGTIPLFAGLASFAAVRLRRLPYRFSARAVGRAEIRELASLAGYVSVAEIAATVVYAADRIVLGIFSSAATVGLFEGPIRAHNVVRALQGAAGVTALPTSARYIAEDDRRRLHELFVRGTRYMLALLVPIVVTGMVLAQPILEVWLGERYREGAAALTILLAYWIPYASIGVGASIVISAGRARDFARLALVNAAANLGLSIALTPWLGLEGVALGTTIPYFFLFIPYMRLILSVVPVEAAELVHRMWAPAYVPALVLAAALLAARLTLPLDSLAPLLASACAGVAAYWAAFWVFFLDPGERELIAGIARRLVPARRR